MPGTGERLASAHLCKLEPMKFHEISRDLGERLAKGYDIPNMGDLAYCLKGIE